MCCSSRCEDGYLPDCYGILRKIMIYELTTILQNSGIRLRFYAIVRHGRMPPMDRENIGGISTDLSSYLGLVCVPPYSQNAGIYSTYVTAWRGRQEDDGVSWGVDSTYITVWRLLAYYVSQLLYSYLKECDI